MQQNGRLVPKAKPETHYVLWHFRKGKWQKITTPLPLLSLFRWMSEYWRWIASYPRRILESGREPQ
jgi:hypothetical protein